MRFTKQKVLLTACISFVLFSLSVPVLVQARGLVPCGGYADDSGKRERPCGVEDVFYMIARVTNWLLSVAGLYGVYKLVQAGFTMITSMGNEEKITQMKGQVSDVVVGLVLVFMAFMFVNFATNYLLTRNLVSTKPECKFDLTDPLKYLKIDTSKCNGLQDSTLYAPPNPNQ